MELDMEASGSWQGLNICGAVMRASLVPPIWLFIHKSTRHQIPVPLSHHPWLNGPSQFAAASQCFDWHVKMAAIPVRALDLAVPLVHILLLYTLMFPVGVYVCVCVVFLVYYLFCCCLFVLLIYQKEVSTLGVSIAVI